MIPTTPVDVASVLADQIHLASFLIIILTIRRRKSCEGWSGRMQFLILITFVTRLWKNIEVKSHYQIIVKIVWIILSTYIIYLIYVKYKKTYEKSCDVFWIESVILTSLSCAFIFCRSSNIDPADVSWQFSLFCEAMSILPQIYFVWLKHEKDIIVTCYVTTLVYYRLLYIAHWVMLYLNGYTLEPVLLHPGIAQVVMCMLYYLLPNGKSKHIEEGQGESTPLPRNRPAYLTQESLLETPLLKRSASSAIFIISDNISDTSSINKSISNLDSEDGRY